MYNEVVFVLREIEMYAVIHLQVICLAFAEVFSKYCKVSLCFSSYFFSVNQKDKLCQRLESLC